MEVFVPSGILSTTSLYILPLLVNIIKLSIVLVLITQEVISSWVFTPLPPLRWVLNDVDGIRLRLPPSVITTTHFSGGIKDTSFSSLVLGSSIWVSSVLRASPYLLTSTPRRRRISSSGLRRRVLSLLISSANSAFSFSISIRSNPANLPSRISTIALACSSLNPYFCCKPTLAFAELSDALIKAIILSISSRAFNKPSTIFNLSFAFLISKLISLIKQSLLCSI